MVYLVDWGRMDSSSAWTVLYGAVGSPIAPSRRWSSRQSPDDALVATLIGVLYDGDQLDASVTEMIQGAEEEPHVARDAIQREHDDGIDWVSTCRCPFQHAAELGPAFVLAAEPCVGELLDNGDAVLIGMIPDSRSLCVYALLGIPLLSNDTRRWA